jgi:long-chain acyl-CoA synthetase
VRGELGQVETAAVADADDVRRRRTIANLWRNAVAAGPRDPAYLHEVNGEWREVTWSEAATAVDELANGLLALGVAKGDAFAILARTRLE